MTSKLDHSWPYLPTIAHRYNRWTVSRIDARTRLRTPGDVQQQLRSILPRHATGLYRSRPLHRRRTCVWQWRVIREMAGAGLWTTASDLARLACEIQRAYQGKPTRLLGKAIVDQALTPQVSEAYGLGIQHRTPFSLSPYTANSPLPETKLAR
ncbi:MAG TPA: hypothetical protein VFA10_21225 [Ktedonobacteraceae bacterium]|nr:hypothetical protein [Ktedonobacteraceae bacterium]